MRIILPSASIAAVSGAWIVGAARGESRDNDNAAISQVVHDVNEAYRSPNVSTTLGRECNSFDIVVPKAAAKRVGKIDLGVLGCGPDETCEVDGSSSLGGRCATATATASASVREGGPQFPIFASRRRRNTIMRQRSLQTDTAILIDGTGGEEEQFTCPTDCPQEFCDCAQNDGDAHKCAAELHSVCVEDLLEACVPNKWLTFYTQTYCPVARCVHVEKKSYEECECGYYKDYCQVYYAYENSIDKCEIGDCCDSQPLELKFTCLPALEPTESPTMSPTISLAPSSSPTVRVLLVRHPLPSLC